jgi:predicted phosphoribosyltransferase
MQADGFRDRRDAGAQLAARLGSQPLEGPLIVCALARGGVPVGFEVATLLHAPLEVLIVRKLGTPGQPELALGALAPDGVRVLNTDLVRLLGVTPAEIDAITAREAEELARREREYRMGRPAPDLRGRCAILVDDGVATGASMEAAVAWARHRQASRVIVAVPVASDSAVARLAREADEVIAVDVPPRFNAVGAWYQDFSQTSDAEVLDLVSQARAHENAREESPPN